MSTTLKKFKINLNYLTTEYFEVAITLKVLGMVISNWHQWIQHGQKHKVLYVRYDVTAQKNFGEMT